MYSMSEASMAAQQSGAAPVTLAVIHSVLGYHCFSDGPFVSVNLPEYPCYQMGSGRLVSVSPITATLIPDAADLFANYTQTESPDCTITLYAGDDDFAAALSLLSFVASTLTIVHGYLPVPYADMLTLFTGVIVRELLDDNGLHLTGVRQ